jgi:membrane protein DedA with SNARE-associated domain
MPAMKTMLRPLIPVVAVLAVPIIPFLFMGNLIEQWVSGLENSRYLPWIVIALLSGDLILPIPSSVVTTYIGGQMDWITGTLVSWVGMSLAAVIGFTLARKYGPQFALRFSSAAQLDNAGNLAGRFGPIFLVLARGVPVVAEASILLMGIHRLSWRRFLIPVLLSNLGISLGYTLFGAVAQQHHWFPVALGVSICVPIGLTLIAQHVLQSKDKNFESGLNEAGIKDKQDD